MFWVVNHGMYKKYVFFWSKLQKIRFCALGIEFVPEKCYTESEKCGAQR